MLNKGVVICIILEYIYPHYTHLFKTSVFPLPRLTKKDKIELYMYKCVYTHTLTDHNPNLGSECRLCF